MAADTEPRAPSHADQAVEIALAEFNALRAEIVSRTTAQAAVVGLGLTALGVIVGFVVQGEDNRLLLAIPPLALFLNLLIVAETYRVASIGEHIRTKLWPYLQAQVGPIPSWEDTVAEYRSSRWTLLVALFIDAPAIVLFSAASVAALALVDKADEPRLWEAAADRTARPITAGPRIAKAVRTMSAKLKLGRPRVRDLRRPSTACADQVRISKPSPT